MNAVTQQDFDGMRQAGRAVRRAFVAMRRAARPGVTTQELDQIGARVLKAAGARSAPQLYYDFPAATCISVNEEAAHGIPGPRQLAAGDIVNIDVSAELNGYVADMGESFTLAKATAEKRAVCAAVQRAVKAALDVVRADRPLGVIGEAVQRVADEEGYVIVENLGSHGVGRSIHEEPSYVPRRDPTERRMLTEGMVLTIEPFFTRRCRWVEELDDGWTLAIPDNDVVAQFEHTLIVTQGPPIVVTA